MTKTLTIEGKEVGFKASALTPTLYQSLTKNDIYDDFPVLFESVANGKMNGATRVIVERMAYTMAKQNDDSIGTIEEWLDSFDNPMFASEIAIDIVKLWTENLRSSVSSKKK